MIDRADLVKIMTEVLGSQEEAENSIREILANSCQFTRPQVVNIEPGKYHYYFVEENINYGTRCLEQATGNRSTGMETAVMLSKNPLQLNEDMVRHVEPDGLEVVAGPYM